MSRTLLASAMALALGFSGYALANPCGDGDWSCNQQTEWGSNHLKNTVDTTQTGNSGATANENSAAYQAIDSFNSSKAIAKTDLEGTVSGISVYNIGNTAYNNGNANGGKGGNGDGGYASGGDGAGGYADAYGGKGGKGIGKGGVAVAVGVAVGGDSISSGGDPHAHSDWGSSHAKGGNSTSGDGGGAAAAAGAAAGNGTGNGGGGGGAFAAAGGGDGGGALAGGGDGGNGGNGGSNKVNAGTFDMSSHMASVGNTAAGIMVVNQNSGIASLAQQGVTVQANLAVGK